MVLQQLTPNTNLLISEINTRTRSWSSLLGRNDTLSPLLIARVAASGERAAIPCLFSLLFATSSTVAESTSDALHQLISSIPLDELPTFDEDMRDLSYWTYSDRWENLSASQVSHLPKTVASQTSVIGLASFHRSGYVRQIATVQLNQFRDGSELPFLLLRLNDWVAAVREAALQVIRQRQVAGYVDHFIRSIALVMRLTDCGRTKSDDVVRWVISQLVLPHHHATLFGLIRDSLPVVRRKCFDYAIEASGDNSQRLIEVGVESADDLIRFRAIQQATRLLNDSELDQVLQLVERDHFMPIRRLVLLIRLERNPAAAESNLLDALLDQSASMRELARYHLAKRGMTDLTAVYRRALTQTKDQATALSGLGETGTNSDIDLVRPFTTSRISKVRLAAVRSLVKLGGSDVVDELVALLPDNGAKITRAAKQGLESHIASLDTSVLWNLAANDQRLHVRRATIELLDQLGAWPGLPFLLRLANDADPEIANMVKRLIRTRFNHVFTTPSPAQRQLLEDLAATISVADDRHFADELRIWLRTRGVHAGEDN